MGELEDENIELSEGVSEVHHGQIWEKKKIFSKLSQLYDLSSRGGAFSAPSLFFRLFYSPIKKREGKFGLSLVSSEYHVDYYANDDAYDCKCNGS